MAGSEWNVPGKRAPFLTFMSHFFLGPYSQTGFFQFEADKIEISWLLDEFRRKPRMLYNWIAIAN